MFSWSFTSSKYISSTIGFHSLTLALINQFDTWPLETSWWRPKIMLIDIAWVYGWRKCSKSQALEPKQHVREGHVGVSRMGFHHAHLLKRPLLSQCLVNDLKPRRFTPFVVPGATGSFSPDGFSVFEFAPNPILQTLECLDMAFSANAVVHRSSTIPRHRFKQATPRSSS